MNTKQPEEEKPLPTELDAGNKEHSMHNMAQVFANNVSLFERLVELAPMGVTLSSSKRTLNYANRAFSQIIGYTKDELAGLDWKQITYEEDQGKNLDLYNDLLAGKIDSFTFEKRYYHKMGHLIWCRLIVSIMPDDEGKMLTIAFIEDVTTEKSNQLMLSQQAAMIRAGEEVSKMGTIIWNIETNETEASPGIFSIYELDPETVNSENLFPMVMRLTHPDDVNLLQEDIQRSVREKALISTDYRIQLPDGRIKYLKSSPGGFLDNKRMLRTIQDVTAEKEKNLLLERQSQIIRLGESTSKMGTAIWNTETYEVEASPNTFAIFELDPAVTDAKHLFPKIMSLVHPDDIASLQKIVELPAEEQLLSSSDFRLLFPDGRIKWLKTQPGKLLDHRRLLVSLQDVSEEIQKNLLLNQQTDMIRLGEQVAKTGTVIWDVNTKEVEASPGIFSIYEIDPETSTKETLLSQMTAKVHPDDSEYLNNNIEIIRSEKIQIDLEYRLRFPDGRIKWVRTGSGKFLDGNRKLAIVQDVTKEKEKALLLKKQANMIQLGEKVAKTGTAVWDIRTRESDASPGLYAILELDSETTGRDSLFPKLMEMVHPDDLPALEKTVEKIARERVQIDVEYRIIMPNGKIKWIKSGSGQFLDTFRKLAIIQDVTTTKEQALKLFATNKEMEQLLYTVSHDLRAPLRHVSSYAQMVQDKSSQKLDEKENKYLENVINASSRLGDMIDELLEYFRNRNIEIEKVRLNLKDIIHSTKKLFELDTLNRNIVWEISPIPEVIADTGMMEKVFLNLLSNAVKFTSKKENPIIRISAERRSKDILIKVSDNGAGFNMKYIDKLFAVFQRLHKRKDFEGTGIGLANVRRIIERHGGNIWAEGELGVGATFYFTLPIAQDI